MTYAVNPRLRNGQQHHSELIRVQTDVEKTFVVLKMDNLPKMDYKMSNFDINAILRGAQLTLVGGQYHTS